MSNQSAVADRPAALPAPLFITSSVRKALGLDAVMLETMLAKMIGQADSEAITPRMLKSNKDSARAGMGAKFTPVSFISGLTYLLACYANGQGNADSLKAGLPPVAAHAFDKASALVTLGKGVTAVGLRGAVVAGMRAIVELPSKSTAAKVGAVSAPLAVAPGSTVAGELIAGVAPADVAPAAATAPAPATAPAAPAAAPTLDPISEAKAIAAADQAIAAVEPDAVVLLKVADNAPTLVQQQAEFIRLAVMLGIALTDDQQAALGMRKAA